MALHLCQPVCCVSDSLVALCRRTIFQFTILSLSPSLPVSLCQSLCNCILFLFCFTYFFSFYFLVLVFAIAVAHSHTHGQLIRNTCHTLHLFKLNIRVHTYVFICVCVCVCLGVWKGEKRKGGTCESSIREELAMLS